MPKRDNMGLDFGLESNDLCFKLKYRWMLTIRGIVGGNDSANALPPYKGARPTLEFKEQEVQHVSETVYFPLKPQWKPINFTLYDNKINKNPIFQWIKDTIYNPEEGEFKPSVSSGFKKLATIEIFDGCGNVIETWKLENSYASNATWGELDMGLAELVTVDITLRYDRAFLVE